MFLEHDFAWWSFALSVVAVVLAIVGILVAIIAPIIAPKLENWWAERSQASARKRITALENQLSEYETKYGPLSEVEDWILKGIEALGILGSMILMFTSLGILVLGTVYKPPQSFLWRFPVPLEYMSLLGMIITIFFMYSIFLKLTTYRKWRSPEVRRILKSSIDRLKSRITPNAEKK